MAAHREPGAAYYVTLPGGTERIEMREVPGGRIGDETVAGFAISTTEVTWDAFDLFLYESDAAEVDGISRPTKPYITVDRGFGHEGYPALSMSAKGAKAFCDWLSLRTGQPFRLPTTSEWQLACLAGTDGPYGFDGALEDHAWFAENSGRRTHRVGTREPNGWGLHDMNGNVAEWCVTGDGGAIVAGGSYLDDRDGVRFDASQRPQAAWNASDPQIPKSPWWLADASFVGLRVVSPR